MKPNIIIMRGVNDDEVVDLATLRSGAGLVVRFIEFMPLDAQGEWAGEKVVTDDEVIAAIDAVWPLDAVAERGLGPPAERFRYRDGGGRSA